MSDSTSTSQTSSQPAATDKGAAPAAAPAATAAASASATASPATTTTAPAAAAPAAVVPPTEPKPGEAVKPADDAATKAAADKAAADAATQAAADKATADKAAADAAAAAAEVYELAPPKGVNFDPALVPAMGPIFKDLKLPKATGEKLVTAFLEYTKALPAKMLARDLEVTMKDPELGGMNYGRTQGMVNDALAAFTTPEFRSKLEKWGIANDLEFVRVFAGIGKAMRGDVAVRGEPTSAEESQADRIYGRAKKVNAQ